MRNLFIAIVLIGAVATGAWAQCSTSCTQNPPGQRWPLIDWRFVNGGTLPQTQGVFMTEDNISVKVESGDALSLTPNEIEMVLTSSVDWRKEITAFSPCSGRGQTIATEGSNKGPARMRINKTNCTGDTVILRKGKLFQGTVDMYHFDPARFFRLWGGKKITINWSQDFVSNPFPPACSFPCVPTATPADQGVLYDTDGKADIAVWRQNFSESMGIWIAKNSSTGATVQRVLGKPGDIPVPYDYDGDGRTDTAVWRPSTGQWLVVNSLTGQLRTVQWGLFGDTPQPGDYDGDGKADLAVWRPSEGKWWIKGYINGFTGYRVGGGVGDVAVAGHYSAANFITDAALWNPSTATWNVLSFPPRIVNWGHIGDTPAPADYDGDRNTDFILFHDGYWYIQTNPLGFQSVIQLGGPGDTPVPQDYDGDGKADLTIFRAWNGEWWILRTTDNTYQFEFFGTAGDIPVPSK